MRKDECNAEQVRLDAPTANEVPFVIEEPVSEEEAVALADVTASASEADDIPFAKTQEAPSPAEEKPRSAWRILSSEDLPQVSLREILGGDYLLGSFLRNNIGFILTLVLMGIVYISNRYGAQQEIIEEENLRKELVEKKNYALTQYALLTQRSRQSSLEQRLYQLQDSTLKASTEPPFIIFRK
ncbi:MAG: hypothetical protein J6W75_10460 [Bacteroidaceae bacterium]|nr:hypothetical protein [Bacteroidaceae bacterium]